MYKQVETDKEFVTATGKVWSPVATLSDGYGKCQICLDDSCYLPFLGSDERPYIPTYYLFRELVDFLELLPRPRLHGYDVGQMNIHTEPVNTDNYPRKSNSIKNPNYSGYYRESLGAKITNF